MEGDWLGNPVNIKGGGYCLDFEVDTGGHVTMTVQSFEQPFQNNMAEYSDLFLFGDDLEAVL